MFKCKITRLLAAFAGGTVLLGGGGCIGDNQFLDLAIRVANSLAVDAGATFLTTLLPGLTT